MMKSTVTRAAAAFAIVVFVPVFAQNLAYQVPSGGWAYAYTGVGDAYGSGWSNSAPVAWDSLDGSWNRGNGSDSWDGTGIGSGKPGGVSTYTEGGTAYLRLQDTGDPRDYGFSPDPSNRKVYVARDLSALGFSGTFMDTGVTLSFRARIPTSGALDSLHPDGGGGIVPYPAEGDGYRIHDGGKGNFTLHQQANGTLSFSLAGADDPNGAGLYMNNLNGTAITGDVDTGEAGTANFLNFDPTQWHEIWITIQAGGSGTHQVSIYMDGSLMPSTIDLTLGSGTDYGTGTIGYMGMGVGSTGFSGALDVDFFSVKEGLFAPTVIPEPSVLSLVGLGLLGLMARYSRRSRG